MPSMLSPMRQPRPSLSVGAFSQEVSKLDPPQQGVASRPRSLRDARGHAPRLFPSAAVEVQLGLALRLRYRHSQ